MSSKVRVFSREMKLAALRRMLAGENVSALAPELQLPAVVAAPDDLAKAQQRIAALEREIGQQQVELDFFDKPCGKSGDGAGRAAGLARRRLRPHAGDDDTAAARRTDG